MLHFIFELPKEVLRGKMRQSYSLEAGAETSLKKFPD